MKAKNIFKMLIIYMLCIIIVPGCQRYNDDNFIFNNKYNDIIVKYENINCISPADAISYPEPWTKEIAESFSISKETLKETSTCGLIETTLNNPEIYAIRPWCGYCSSFSVDGIAYFNNIIADDEVIQELLTRADVVEKLTGRYSHAVSNKSPEKDEATNRYLAVLIASDAVRPLLTNRQAEDLLVLSLKMINKLPVDNYDHGKTDHVHILVSALMHLNYEPFLNDSYFVDGKLETVTTGYKICNEAPDLVIQYSIDYLNLGSK